MISPVSLETVTICCLSLRKDMNLRNSKRNYEEKIRLSLKNIKSLERKKRKPLQSNENIKQTVKIVPKTPKKCEKKTCLDDSHNFGSNMSLVTSTPVPHEIRNRRVSSRLQNLNHDPTDRKTPISRLLYPITSTPIQQTLWQTVSTKAKEQKSNHLSKKKSIHKKISQTSFIMPVESVNENTKSRSNKSTELSSRCSMTLRSQHSQQESLSCKSSAALQSQHTKKTSNKDSSSKSKISLRSQNSWEVSYSGLSSKSSKALQSLSQKSSRKSSSNHIMILRSFSSNNEQEVDTIKIPRKSCTVVKDKIDHDIKITALQNESYKNPQKSAGSIEKQRSSERMHENLDTSSKRSPTSPKNVATKNCTKPSVLENVPKTLYKKKILAPSKSLVQHVTIDDLSLPASTFRVRKVKSADFKLPGKNTLKRKRCVMDILKKADEDYQDDIYESKTKTFDKFKELLMNTSDSDRSFATVSTPKLGFQVTPRIPHKTPKFRDCFSPTEYAVSRKVAEEYIHRCKNKKRVSQPPIITPPVIPEKKKLEFSQIVADAQKVQETCEKLIDECDSDDDNDNSYFSFC